MLDVTFARRPLTKTLPKPFVSHGVVTDPRDVVTSVVLVDSEYLLSGGELSGNIPRPSPRCLHVISDWVALTDAEQTALRATLGHAKTCNPPAPRVCHTKGAAGLLEAVCATEGLCMRLTQVYLVMPEENVRADFTSVGVAGGRPSPIALSNRQGKAARAPLGHVSEGEGRGSSSAGPEWRSGTLGAFARERAEQGPQEG